MYNILLLILFSQMFDFKLLKLRQFDLTFVWHHGCKHPCSVLCAHQDIKEATTKRQTKTKQLNLHFQEKLPLHFDHASSNIVNILDIKTKYKTS